MKLILIFVVHASAVWNALHDSRGKLGDAMPCCEICDEDLLGPGVCPDSMRDRTFQKVVRWSEWYQEEEVDGTGIVIPCGLRVDLDVSPPLLNGLYVRGHLHVQDGVDISLRSDFIYVCGVLSAGTSTSAHQSKFEVTLTGMHTVEESGIDYGVKAFAVFGGLIYLRGIEKQSWTFLKGSVYPGDTKLKFQNDVDWPIGSKIVVASTDWDAEQTEELDLIESVAHNYYVVSKPFQFAHSGVPPTAAEVGLLSRNIRITSVCDVNKNDQRPICGHFVISHTPHGFISGVEFTHLGAHTTLGKYPVHLHMCGVAPSLKIKFNSIHHNYHRSLVIHSTADVEISRNIAYLTQGHMYVFENGLEIRNKVIENLGLVTRPPIPSWTCDTKCAGSDLCGFGTGDNIEECGSRDDAFAEIFWISNPDNNFIGNHAVGGHRSAFSFYPVISGPLISNVEEQHKIGLPEHIIQILKTEYAFGRQDLNKTIEMFGMDSLQKKNWRSIDRRNHYQNTGAQHIEFAPGGQFDNNVAHSVRIGFSVYPQWTPRSSIISSTASSSDYGRNEQNVIWKKLKAYKVFGSAFRFKLRCAKWNCLTVQDSTIIAATMAFRARDVYSRFSIKNTRILSPTQSRDMQKDRAFIGGACLLSIQQWNPWWFNKTTSKSEKANSSHICYSFKSAPYSRPTQYYSHSQQSNEMSSEGYAFCSPCGLSWPPKEHNTLVKIRECTRPFWGINFDYWSIKNGHATEACAINGKNSGRHSCYIGNHARTSLPATAKVDVVTLNNMIKLGYVGNYSGGYWEPIDSHDECNPAPEIMGAFHGVWSESEREEFSASVF